MPPKQTKVVANRKTVMPISRAGRAQIRRKDSNTQNNMNDQGMEDEEIDQQREGMKNQYEQLTAQELNEDMPSKMLEPKNPQAPKNITVYDYYTRKFKTDELVDQMIVHFSMDGDYIWKESNEYKTQEEIRDTKKTLIKEAMRKQESEEPGANHDEEAIKQTLRNKFNYNTRECQTINPSIRERGVSTEPPPSDTICGNITQWEIFDAYYAEIMKASYFALKVNLKNLDIFATSILPSVAKRACEQANKEQKNKTQKLQINLLECQQIFLLFQN